MLTPKGIIRRPEKGYGRYSGKFMHRLNHTKRVTNGQDYDHNVDLLNEIRHNDPRWKTDGLSDLRFRIASYTVDDELRDYGVRVHHVRVRRGGRDYNP
eukprot:CAMPEP_0168696956 /NCGR_PEP_ID=MMETSP0503-20121227/35634_1 /TAXON_ID=89963 /ORGANISM="Heterocapsa rotundata, Strain SCCAP K-0483" /LENGTH=97 /DNA_ID=CAMNT_0008742763 /DNA_START=1 /DNA_END=290 /DNA_ORIENTATION=-